MTPIVTPSWCGSLAHGTGRTTTEIAHVNGVELEYEVRGPGSGDPVLLISPVLADGFLPLMDQPVLADGARLVHYHKRGWVGSTPTPGPVSVSEHAEDAIALPDHLGIDRAHVAGHSSGAAVAVELALAAPDRVRSVVLLELSLLALPEGQAFLADAGPVLEAFAEGHHETAVSMFLSAVSGLEWETCREVLESRVPGMVDQTLKDAHTFFGVELPTLAAWTLEPDRAAAIEQPVLFVRGSRTLPLWVEVAAHLRDHVARFEEAEVDGVGHLLHLQRPEPVATAVSAFVRRHPIAG